MNDKARPLPPYGKRFSPVPAGGIRVAIGAEPNVWEFAKRHHAPCMVVPPAENPDSYRWPADNGPVLVFEVGDYNDERLEALAKALLQAGASSVVAIREALLDSADPRVFYDAA